jgi:hypothetical protein
MPILFGLFGLILIVTGVRGTVNSGTPSLVSLVKDDFIGTDPFWKWMLAILLIGAIGYIPNLRPISRAFMALVIVVFLLSNNGLFTQLQNVFSNTSTTATPQGSINAIQPTSTNFSVPTNTGLNTSLEPVGNVQGILNIQQLTQPLGINPLE